MRPALIAAAALLLAAPGALSQTLAERQKQAEAEARLAEAAGHLPEACGVPIAVRIDWSGFAEGDYAARYSIDGYCQHAVDAVRHLCQDDLGREAVAARITGLVCARGEGLSGEIAEDGTYRYTFDWDSADMFFWHREFLRNNL